MIQLIAFVTSFMQKNMREKDLASFAALSREPRPARADVAAILMPAFMILGIETRVRDRLLLFLPFLIIDSVVASVLMSMGMTMLPRVVVSLPFKLIFLRAGRRPVAGSLVQSYGLEQ